MRCFNDYYIEKFSSLLLEINWSSVYDSVGANSEFDSLYNTVSFHFDKSFPKKLVKIKKSVDARWITTELREISRRSTELSELNQVYKNGLYHREYQELKTIYLVKLKHAKKTCNDDRISSADNEVKESWKIIKEAHNGYTGNAIPCLQSAEGGDILSDNFAICNLFSEYFSTVSSSISKPDTKNINYMSSAHQSIYLYPATKMDIKQVIKKVCKKKSSGINEIPGHVFKEIANVISEPLELTHIVNSTFIEGRFPDILKMSKVLANKSTVVAIDQLIKHALEILENKQQPLGLFFDLSKAFDLVDHDILLHKLSFYGIRGSALNWVGSYLPDRSRQLVCVNGINSKRKMYIKRGTSRLCFGTPPIFGFYK
ncbi:uncharacterized protein [Leptinotarsa decemlineata]|uniref:uncharacterized protein n=1 Tax=Leptinotarsa decemlineata TaxID=7539 RepID=UPI003D30718F